MTCLRFAVSLAGNLSRHLPQWRDFTTNEWVLGVLESGFRLPWADVRPPLTRLAPACRSPALDEVAGILAMEVALLLEKHAVERVLDQHSPGFYGRLFVVPKSTGGWRPVLDLSLLNASCGNSVPYGYTSLRARSCEGGRLGFISAIGQHNPGTRSSWSSFTYHRSNCSCEAYRYFSPAQAFHTGT